MQRICQNGWCKAAFDVTEEDMAFYDKISPVFSGQKYPIPAPTFCPDCRFQRRLSYRNERNLYRRDCDLCKKSIVSVYRADTKFPVYCNRCWWSDAWDPFATGAPYDPSVPFLDQWTALRDRTPQLAIQNDNTAGSENCEYCYDFAFGKNCYLANCTWHIEDSYYCTSCNFTKFMVDCHMTNHECELCYECIDCERIYACSYLQNSENCHQCMFGYDLKGCSDCFACFGLRHKKFHIFNKPVDPEVYAKHMQEWTLGSFKDAERMKEEFSHWILQFPRQYTRMRQSEMCAGNNIFNCKNVVGFDVYGSEESKYVDWTNNMKHCYDLISSSNGEWCLDSVTPDNSHKVLFSNWCWKCNDVLYSDNCHSSQNLLGCTGLKHKKHCILNRAYSPEEYEALAGRILDELCATDLWGNFFPASYCPFAYNETAATEQYPLTKDEAIARGWQWQDALPFMVGKETIKAGAVPDCIGDVDDGILSAVLACTSCARNYKIIAPELRFYRERGLPLPRRCPQCRHLARIARRMPKKLWPRHCAKCAKAIQTTYQPSRSEIVYCEECYLAEVY